MVAFIAVIVCTRFDVSEALTAWARPHEGLQLDELPGILLVVAVSLVWFSSRRYFQVKREITLRREAEARLAAALAENKRLALKYVDMQEQERKSLAHDLHDELGQYVNAIKLDAVSMRDATADQVVLNGTASAMIVNIDRVYAVLRGLIRQLRPVGFDELGVLAALEHCISEWRTRLPATSIEVATGGDLETLDEERGLVIFRLVQEALTNCARHSGATQVRISVERSLAAGGIEVVIADNGCGIDLNLPRAGLGLIGMRERVAALGGSIILSGAPGQGFKVTAFLPLGSGA